MPPETPGRSNRLEAVDPSIHTARWSPVSDTIYVVLAIIGLAAFGAVIAARMGGGAGGSDSSGYINAAQLIGEGRLHAPRRIPALPHSSEYPEYLTTPLGFKPSGPTQMTPTYPLGFPAIIAAVTVLFGPTMAPKVTIWLHAIAALVLVGILAKKARLSNGWAIAGMVLLGTSPLMLSYSVQAMSDVPAMVWVTLIIVTAWSEGKAGVRHVFVGIAFSMAIFVRPTNVLALIPLSVCLAADWRKWLFFGLGGIPGGFVWFRVNVVLYGKAISTGYGDMSNYFGTAFAGPTFVHYAVWLPVILSPAVALLLVFPFLGQISLRLRVLVGAWVVPWLGFYAVYSFTGSTWWYLRFLLPCFPALILGTLLAAKQVTRGWGSFGIRASGAAALVCLLIWSTFWTRKLFALNSGIDDRIYQRGVMVAEQTIPKHALILAMQMSGALECYSKRPFLRWDFIDPDLASGLRQDCLAQGKSIYAVLFPFEVQEVTRRRLPGPWKEIASVGQIGIWRLERLGSSVGDVRHIPVVKAEVARSGEDPIHGPVVCP